MSTGTVFFRKFSKQRGLPHRPPRRPMEAPCRSRQAIRSVFQWARPPDRCTRGGLNGPAAVEVRSSGPRPRSARRSAWSLFKSCCTSPLSAAGRPLIPTRRQQSAHACSASAPPPPASPSRAPPAWPPASAAPAPLARGRTPSRSSLSERGEEILNIVLKHTMVMMQHEITQVLYTHSSIFMYCMFCSGVFYPSRGVCA